MPAHRFTHLRLLVDDFPACFRFYRDVLELTPTFGGEQDVYTEFTTGHTIIALFRKPLMSAVLKTASLPAAAKAQDAAVLTFGVDDVDAACSALKTKGVAFATAPHDQPEWHIRVAHLRDPDGRLIELYSPLRR